MKILSIVFLAMSATAASTSSISKSYNGREPQDVHEHDVGVVDWYVKSVRGMYAGMVRGLYHDKKKIDAKCLSEDVKNEVHSVMEFLAYGEFADIFTLADSLTSLYFDNRQYCKGADVAADLESHCKSKTEDGGRPCTVGSFVKSLSSQSHLMATMGATSVLAETYRSLDVQVEADEIYEQTMQLGKQLGTLFAIGIGF